MKSDVFGDNFDDNVNEGDKDNVLLNTSCVNLSLHLSL